MGLKEDVEALLDKHYDNREVLQAINHNGVIRVGEVVRSDGEEDAFTIVLPAPETDQNSAPTAAITTAPSSPGLGETVSFDGSGSSDPDGTVESYEWTIDGGTFSGQVVEQSYDSPGDKSAQLVVTDDDGATDAAQSTVTVEMKYGQAGYGEHGYGGVAA